MVLSRSIFRTLSSPVSRSWALILAMAVMTAACAPEAATDHEAQKDPMASEYVETPAVQSAQRTSDGQISIFGRAAANAIVRLSAPEGQSW
eukprot:gene13442-15554_t